MEEKIKQTQANKVK